METIIFKREFKGTVVNFYGSLYDPLFHIDEVTKLLFIDNINVIVQCLRENEISNCKKFITKYGLYRILFQVNDITNFMEWVDKQLKTHLDYDEVEKTGYVYVIKTDVSGAYKIGRTKDVVSKRVRGLQTANLNDIKILFEYKTSDSVGLEYIVHRILDKYRCNRNREFFTCNLEFIKMIIRVMGKTIDTCRSCYHMISKIEFLLRLKKQDVEQELPDENTDEDPWKIEVNLFHKWLDENIKFEKNGLLQTRDVCKLFLNEQNLFSKELSKYKTEIEKWIEKRFDKRIVQSSYSTVKINNKTYKGWKNVVIKE